MPRIDGGAGAVPVGSLGTKPADNPAATVQVGESRLSEVAQRLGVDANSLQNANPQISDPTKLKVGQEIHLPPFQPAETLKENDEPGLQSQGAPSGLPRAPMGDPLAKNAMQARLSATDLAQLPGGAQQVSPQQMKFADKGTTADKLTNADKPLEADQTTNADKTFQKADDLAQVPGGAQQVNVQQMKFADKGVTSDKLTNADQLSKADKPLEADQTTNTDKPFQKADDLAQVAGGAGRGDLQYMKEAGKAIYAGKGIDAGKLINPDQTDKSTDPKKTFSKVDEATKTFEITQDAATNKVKTANKAAEKVDAYIRQ